MTVSGTLKCFKIYQKKEKSLDVGLGFSKRRLYWISQLSNYRNGCLPENCHSSMFYVTGSSINISLSSG